MSNFGFDLLEEQAIEAASEIASITVGVLQTRDGIGDTPIERLFYCALCAYVRFSGDPVFTNVAMPPPEYLRSSLERDQEGATLYLQRQVQIKDVGRVDFVVYAPSWVSTGGEDELQAQWHELIIECDGHEFHERTKEQAAKDRSKDRSAQLAGYKTFRFTGSELWRDPWKCAAEVVAWASQL